MTLQIATNDDHYNFWLSIYLIPTAGIYVLVSLWFQVYVPNILHLCIA